MLQVWSKNRARKLAAGSGFIEWSRNAFVEDCLHEHNRVRALHGASGLMLSQHLCEEAQQWANRLAQKKILEYSNRNGRGESILTCTTAEGISGEGTVRAWYETGRTYNYNCPSSADLAHAGEFSQLLWRSSRDLGIGVARGEGNRIVVVARYSPSGNQPGHFLENVRPPIRRLPTEGQLSRTREEANMSVQTALLPPSPKSSSLKGLTKKPNSPKVNQNGIAHPSRASLDEQTVVASPDEPPRSRGGRMALPVCCGVTVGRRRNADAPGTPRPARHLTANSSSSYGSYRMAGPTRRVAVGSASVHPDPVENQVNSNFPNDVTFDSDSTPLHQTRPSRYALPSSVRSLCSSPPIHSKHNPRSSSVLSPKSTNAFEQRPRSTSAHQPLDAEPCKHQPLSARPYLAKLVT
ncbi:CAP domain [Trinorchestia longiramus]|nr:CAP domain [Trinorchestia longiramus]